MSAGDTTPREDRTVFGHRFSAHRRRTVVYTCAALGTVIAAAAAWMEGWGASATAWVLLGGFLTGMAATPSDSSIKQDERDIRAHPGPSPPERRVLRRLHGASLLVVSTVIYVSAIAGCLYTLETAYYLPAKSEYITNQLRDQKYINFEVATPATNAAKEFAERSHDRRVPQQRVEELRRLATHRIESLMDASPEITRVELLDPNYNPLLEVDRRHHIREQHDFSNSILTRSFEKSALQAFRLNDENATLVGIYRIFVTTAKGDPEIEWITSYYRWWMIVIVVGLTLMYGYLLFFVLFPLSRVLTSMQTKRGLGGPILPRVRSPLERAYNNLARDAGLTRFSKEIREIISRHGISHTEPILNQVPRLVFEHLGVSGCCVYILSRKGDGRSLRLDKAYPHVGGGYPVEPERLIASLEEWEEKSSDKAWAGTTHTTTSKDGSVTQFYCDILASNEDRLSVIVLPCSFPGSAGSWWTDYFTKIAQETRYAISSVEEQRRMILQEKSKANISLSRNLGHDLTNIIATSKLELMTIQAFLSLRADDVMSSPQKEQLFRESLEALLNNTRFLQEIVNLYRSFSYLQKPKFEETHIGDMVRDVVKLYQLSNPKHIAIRTNIKGEFPAVRVEPRLLRLALFNLLTNASESIKRATSADAPEGIITIDATCGGTPPRIEIRVADTGTGIRDAEGKLLSPDSISEIFQLGFSTKANQEGEGLGLNWVQTIVREFHGGEILAANRSKGGAVFTIRLPVARPPDTRLDRPIPTATMKQAQEESTTRVKATGS